MSNALKKAAIYFGFAEEDELTQEVRPVERTEEHDRHDRAPQPRERVEEPRRARMMYELAAAAGTPGGMVAGQVADLEGEGKRPEAALLESIHRAKTGALLRASVRIGAMAAGASEAELEALSRYGEHTGLAFQIVDDILDVEQPSEALGKTAGKDAAQHKITFPAVYGVAESRRMAERERMAAHEALGGFGGRAARLREIADFIVHRRS